jgi:1-deoxy-D-xylulose-5-phosphate reductoisomerase
VTTPPGAPQGVALLGATGSVGAAAADVLLEHPERFRVELLAANRRGPELLALARRMKPRLLCLVDEQSAADLRPALRRGDPEFLVGEGALLSVLREPGVDVVLQAITGAAGLASSLETVRHGKRLALANKESLVVAGPLLTAEARRRGAVIVPVDSEHSAIFQCLAAGRRAEVRRIVLTASGGPFRGRAARELASVTPAEALRHPTWSMGPRITIDSATLMNKALEVIEARWLFDVAPEQIEVVVHPQSIVHSMVEFVDGSVVAQMSPPDMRGPVRYALSWPERLPAARPVFDVKDYARLTFEAPDRAAFPALDLGFEAARRGGTAGAALNAADEVAVAEFLAGEIPFPEIARRCAHALDAHPFDATPDLAGLLRADAWARSPRPLAC